MWFNEELKLSEEEFFNKHRTWVMAVLWALKDRMVGRSAGGKKQQASVLHLLLIPVILFGLSPWIVFLSKKFQKYQHLTCGKPFIFANRSEGIWGLEVKPSAAAGECVTCQTESLTMPEFCLRPGKNSNFIRLIPMSTNTWLLWWNLITREKCCSSKGLKALTSWQTPKLVLSLTNTISHLIVNCCMLSLCCVLWHFLTTTKIENVFVCNCIYACVCVCVRAYHAE